MWSRMLVGASIICLLSACGKQNSTSGAGASPSEETTGTVAETTGSETVLVTPPPDTGTPYTVEHKGTLMLQGYVALVAPDEVRFAVRDDANHTMVPRTTAKVIIPGSADEGVPATGDPQNAYFTAKLPKPVDPPVTATLDLQFDGAEPQKVEVALTKVESQ